MFYLSKNKFLVSTIVIIAIIFGIFAFFKFLNNPNLDTLSQTSNKIKVGLGPYASNIYIYAGIEQGIFARHNIEIDQININTSTDAINALVANNIDSTGYFSLDVGLNALISDPNAFKILATGYEKAGSADEMGTSIIAKSSSTISSFNDLEGKKIAVQPSPFSIGVLKNVLTKNGVDLSKVEIVQIVASDQIQILEAGSVDAAFIFEPYVTISQSKNFKIIESGIYTKYYKDAPALAFFISNNFIKNKPEVSRQYRDALTESIEYVNKNREASLKLLPKYIKIEQDVAAKVKIFTFDNPNKIDVANIQNYADFSASQGVLKGKIEVKNLIYTPR
jgi:NitT/TauT family transport system substrate-binding protein